MAVRGRSVGVVRLASRFRTVEHEKKGKEMSKQSKSEKATDPKQQQLEALEAANKQQLEALAQQRELAMESAKYWDNVAEQAAAGLPEAQAAALPARVSSTVLTEAHFTYLESVLKAQVEFTRTLLTSATR